MRMIVFLSLFQNFYLWQSHCTIALVITKFWILCKCQHNRWVFQKWKRIANSNFKNGRKWFFNIHHSICTLGFFLFNCLKTKKINLIDNMMSTKLLALVRIIWRLFEHYDSACSVVSVTRPVGKSTNLVGIKLKTMPFAGIYTITELPAHMDKQIQLVTGFDKQPKGKKDLTFQKYLQVFSLIFNTKIFVEKFIPVSKHWHDKGASCSCFSLLVIQENIRHLQLVWRYQSFF